MKLKVFVALILAIGIFAWISYQTNQPDKVPVNQEENQEKLNTPNTLRIPSLNLTLPVIFPKSNNEEDIQEALKYGVSYYPGTALAGKTGNMYIVGHSSDNPWAKGDYKRVFAGLPKLSTGDKIEITDRAGLLFVYRIIETKIVSPKDLTVLNQPDDKKLLTLQTSYPIGTAFKRFIVVSELVGKGGEKK